MQEELQLWDCSQQCRITASRKVTLHLQCLMRVKPGYIQWVKAEIK